MRAVKCSEHIEIVASKSGELLFFKQRDGPWYPSLKLLHKYPFMMPHAGGPWCNTLCFEWSKYH